MPKTITQVHASKSGKTSDKWASYLGYYDRLLAPWQSEPVSMLEIGVQNGGSLETWAEYFEAGRLFVGCDIDPKCGSLAFADGRIRVIVGDINSQPSYDQVRTLSSEYDIIIDDGSHLSSDIVFSFVNYFPMLRPGGLYIVEDAHALYEARFGGGVLSEVSAYALFKKLVDTLSFQFWSADLSMQTHLRTFFMPDAIPSFILDGWIDSIEFRNSVITIRKTLAPGHDKLGPRLVRGAIAGVNAAVLAIGSA